MKKSVALFLSIILLVSSFGIVFAANENSAGNSGDNSNDDEVLGASCGTVTPGTQNECCVNKGYSGWDEENFECIGENEEEQNQGETQNQEMNQNQNTLGNTNQNKKLTESQKQKIIQARNQLRINAQNQECPQNCSCTGSTTKCTLNGSREMIIRAGNSNNTIVQIKNYNASTQVMLYKSEDGKVYAVFKDNETKEIILPDEVQERLRERIHMNDSNMVLNENGEYEIQAQKQARLLWMIKVREKTRLNVDAETGEIIRQRNSWWGFLAKDTETDSE